MKALLLVGGQGTRLRPLTVHAPKSIVPIFDRPFLHYQLDLIKQVPEIDEVILSLNYQPHRIEEVFGDGHDAGIKLRYVVEPTPLGTAGAVRYAAQGVRDTIVVFNGDVLTQVDLRGLIDFHRSRARPRDHRSDASRKPDGLWPGRNRRRPAISFAFSKSRSPRRSPATRSTLVSMFWSPIRSIAFLPTWRGRSSAAFSRRSSSAARRFSPRFIGTTGSISARLKSTCRCIATSWTGAT